MPLPELLDRWSILKLKIERIKEPHLNLEMEAYQKALDEFEEKGIEIKKKWLDELYDLNKQIWDLESDIRNGKEEELGLEEVGRRAILIRETNKKRITVKNKIVEESGHGFKDVKMNHISE